MGDAKSDIRCIASKLVMYSISHDIENQKLILNLIRNLLTGSCQSHQSLLDVEVVDAIWINSLEIIKFYLDSNVKKNESSLEVSLEILILAISSENEPIMNLGLEVMMKQIKTTK